MRNNNSMRYPMMFAWTKQFLVATGLFALVLVVQTTNMALKDKQLAEKQLEGASRIVRVTPASDYFHN